MPRSLVWDLPSRLFHWALALCLVGSWATAEAGFDWTEWHFRFGYAAIALVVFRVLWGFVGTRHALFKNFVRGPSSTFENLQSIFKRSPSAYAGHTPLGGWSVILMLILVAVQAGTGLFISDDIFWSGPYNGVVSSSTAGTLAQIHHLNFTALQIVVALHIAAIIWYRLGKNTRLVGPMVHGRKTLADNSEAIESSRWPLAALVFIVVAAAVTALVVFAPPPPVDDYMF